jgi:hypothetical protein
LIHNCGQNPKEYLLKMRAMVAGVDTMARYAWFRLGGTKPTRWVGPVFPGRFTTLCGLVPMEGWQLVHLESPKARGEGVQTRIWIKTGGT